MVALRGSVPADVLTDFRHVLSRYARFKHSQRAQVADIYSELSQPRWASPGDTPAVHDPALRLYRSHKKAATAPTSIGCSLLPPAVTSGKTLLPCSIQMQSSLFTSK